MATTEQGNIKIVFLSVDEGLGKSPQVSILSTGIDSKHKARTIKYLALELTQIHMFIYLRKNKYKLVQL